MQTPRQHMIRLAMAAPGAQARVPMNGPWAITDVLSGSWGWQQPAEHWEARSS